MAPTPLLQAAPILRITNTFTGNYATQADSFKINSEAGNYVDACTGKPIKINVVTYHQKWKIDEGDGKAKLKSDDSKTKVEKDGDAKTKADDGKVKIDYDGTKVK
jgi:hypothetical protein